MRLVAIALLWDDYVPDSDAFSYRFIAEHPFRLLTADLRVVETALRPPAYPLALAAVGASVGAGQVLNAVLGSVAAVLAAVVGRRLGGTRAGWVAGGLVAVHPALLANDVVLLSEPLAHVALLALVLLLVDRCWWGAGIAAGVLVLTRPPGPLLALVAVAWLWRRMGWRPAVGAAAVVAFLAAPWLAFNADRFGSPVLTTSVGFNLAAAYGPDAREAGRFVTPVLDPSLDEVEQDAQHRRVATESLRDDPLQVLEVSTRNVVDLLELTPSDNEEAERLDGRSMGLRRWTLPVVWAVLALGAVGLRRARTWLLVALASAAVVPSVLTVAAPRLRSPLDLVCCIGVALLVFGRDRERRAIPRP